MSAQTGSASTLERVRFNLVGLKMARALEMLDTTVKGLEQGEISPLEAIDLLLSEELTMRENRRVKVALMTSRLTQVKTLQQYDFSFQPSVDRNQILTLAQLGFVERKEVVHLLGPPGTGKSHLAIALGVEAIKAGKSVYLATLAEIIASLLKAEREGTLPERIRFLTRTALLIIDEVGYLPLERGGAHLFFQLVNARYEKGAIILTSNRGFAEWGDIFGDRVIAAALLDRLLHHAVVIQIDGNSYRLREHAALMPENLKAAVAGKDKKVDRPRGRPPKEARSSLG
ncbi:MAG: IS21-like element helper ATPase IstB [Candidatus Eisenbacteria bacterium]